MKEKLRLRFVLKVCSAIFGILILLTLLIIANGLLGNPVSYLLAKNSANRQLAAHYSETGYRLDSVSYSFKEGCYYANASIPNTLDSAFTMSFDLLGRSLGDDYESRVTNGFNTFNRLETAYRALCGGVLDSQTFPYQKRISIGFGTLKTGLDEYHFVPEGIYNLQELGTEYGELTVYFDDPEVNYERAAERLLELKEWMDKGGVTFGRIYFVLQTPFKSNDPELQCAERYEDREEIVLKDFPAADIYEEGLVARVEANAVQTAAEFAAEDAENAKEIKQKS